MQVLTPQDFSRIIFSATASPQPGNFNPQHHFKSPAVQAVPMAPMFHHPPPGPKSFYSEHGSSVVFNNVDEVKSQVAFLESEVRRMSDELRVKADSSKRERQARDKLTRENECLRSDLSKMKSVLHSRDEQIHELERQLMSSQNQLSLLKRRYLAAVEEARHLVPGTIKNIQRDQHSIGVQVDEMQGLEERIYKLTMALREEKSRNKRVKSIITSDSYYENASVPPVPRIPKQRSRGTSVHAYGDHRQSPRLIQETIPLAYIHRRRPRLNTSQFMVINCRSINAPPPQEDLSGISAIHQARPPNHLPSVSPISPIYRRPLRYDQRSSFEVFQDKDLLSLSPPPLPPSRAAGGLCDINTRHQKISSKTRMVEPDQFDISSPMNHHSSEDAIKRAVAAAVEKRKQLASMGMSVGSRSSSISSFMSEFGGQKARFGCFLG
jgi:hypothetical protein